MAYHAFEKPVLKFKNKFMIDYRQDLSFKNFNRSNLNLTEPISTQHILIPNDE